MSGKHGPPEWRFWRHVDKHGPLPEAHPELGRCWLWLGTGYLNGYGQWRPHHDGRSGSAHRYAYEYTIGPIPDGLTIDHLCSVRRCVNPAHLEPVTLQENQRRALFTHCRRGHPLSGENLYLSYRENGQPHRECRICMRLRAARFKARHASAVP